MVAAASNRRLACILAHLDAGGCGSDCHDQSGHVTPQPTAGLASAAAPRQEKRVSPFLKGIFAPIRKEVTEASLKIIAGELPAGLQGALVRNGPNPQFDIVGPYHWFDGDGMVHVVDIAVDDQGSLNTLRYRNRYVRTKRLADDAKRGRSSAPIGNAMAGDFTQTLELAYKPGEGEEDYGLVQGTANTSVVHHAGQLLALHEGDMPYALDAKSLETKERFSYGGQLKHRVTAHPKVDPVSKDLIFFGANNQITTSKPFMHYSVANAEGKLVVANLPIELRGPQVMHDIAITEHYSIILDFPLFMRPERLAEGKSLMHHDLDMPTRFGLLPRHATSGAEVRWFETSPCFAYHVANAWEHDGVVSMVGCRSPNMDLGGLGSSVFRLHRWDLELATGIVHERQLSSLQCEFCVVDSQLVGRYARYVYAARFADQSEKMTSSMPTFNGLVQVDLDTGAIREHVFENGILGGEAVFSRCGKTGLDGEGVLMTYAFNPSTSTSELYVVDALNMTRAARVALPERVPYGFHATWVPAASI